MEANIVKKIAEITRRPVEEIRLERPLRELVHDSFGLVEMVVELQESYSIQVSQADFASVQTVRDLTRLISERLPESAN